MIRRGQILLLLLLLLIIGGVGTYLYYHNKGKEYRAAAMAVPESTVIAYQGQKLSSAFIATSKQELYRFLGRRKDVEAFNREFYYFDSLLYANPLFKKVLQTKPLVVALNVPATNAFHLVFLQQPEGTYDESDIEAFVQKIHPGTRIFEHVFKGIKVYDVKSATRQSLFSYSFPGGILALSRDPLTVEDAVNGFLSHSQSKDPMTTVMAGMLDKEKIFINYTRLPYILSNYSSGSYHNELKDMDQLAGYGVYDWNFEKQKFTLSGELVPDTDNQSMWSLFAGQHAHDISIDSILPASTALYMDWNIDRFDSFYFKYKAFLKEKKWLDDHDKKAKEAPDMSSWIGNEWAYALLEPASDDAASEPMMVIKPKDINKALNSLNATELKDNDGNNTVYRDCHISQLALKESFSLVFGNLFKAFDRPYFTNIGSYFIFAPGRQTLLRCIDAHFDKQNLRATPAYKEQRLKYGNSNFLLYLNPGKSALLGYSYARETYHEKYRDNMSVYKGFNAFVFQINAEGQTLKNTLNLGMTSSALTSSSALWSLTLDADMHGKPYILAAAASKKNILVQDINNQIYLIGNGSNVLWKRNINEAIVGEVTTIDLYKNGQLEYLFATENQLYLIDLSGNDVGGYPIRLGTRTKTGVALFDFNNNKDYSYFVEGEGNRVYGYNGNGSPLSEWASVTTDSRLSCPLKRINIAEHNYLIGLSDKGMVYAWTEKGRAAVKPIASKTHFKNPVQISFGPTLSECSVLCLDTGGVFYDIKLGGSIAKRSFRRFGKSPYFLYFDANGNKQNEYIIAGNKMIGAYEKDTAMIWKLLQSENLSYAPQKLEFGKDFYIGYTSTAANKVYLFRYNGTPFGNFPQRGNGPFAVDDMTGNGDLSMVIGGKDKMLYLYRLGR